MIEILVRCGNNENLCEETMSIISICLWIDRKRKEPIRCASMLRLVSLESHLSSSYSFDEYEIDFFVICLSYQDE